MDRQHRHLDHVGPETAAFFRDDHEQSLLTFMVYLNEGFTGGATNFPDLGRTIVPRVGLGLLFQHALLHEGCMVEDGVQYAVRSDVMWSCWS